MVYYHFNFKYNRNRKYIKVQTYNIKVYMYDNATMSYQVTF